MMSIRSERSDRVRDITNTRKLLTRPKTTCRSKVSFTLCKKMIKHSSQAKNLPKQRIMICRHFSSGLSAFAIILSAFSLLIFFSIKPRSNTRLSQGKRPSRVRPPPLPLLPYFVSARVITIAKLLTRVIACSFRCP